MSKTNTALPNSRQPGGAVTVSFYPRARWTEASLALGACV